MCRIYGQDERGARSDVLSQSAQPGAGFSATQMRLVARVQGGPDSHHAPRSARSSASLDPDVPLASVEPMEGHPIRLDPRRPGSAPDSWRDFAGAPSIWR
jgi:hypothetical protein